MYIYVLLMFCYLNVHEFLRRTACVTFWCAWVPTHTNKHIHACASTQAWMLQVARDDSNTWLCLGTDSYVGVYTRVCISMVTVETKIQAYACLCCGVYVHVHRRTMHALSRVIPRKKQWYESIRGREEGHTYSTHTQAKTHTYGRGAAAHMAGKAQESIQLYKAAVTSMPELAAHQVCVCGGGGGGLARITLYYVYVLCVCVYCIPRLWNM
jgi:hypothetical protein